MSKLNINIDKKNSKINKEMVQKGIYFSVSAIEDNHYYSKFIILLYCLILLMNHVLYKRLLFLEAGSIIPFLADNQDFKKYVRLKLLLLLIY